MGRELAPGDFYSAICGFQRQGGAGVSYRFHETPSLRTCVLAFPHAHFPFFGEKVSQTKRNLNERQAVIQERMAPPPVFRNQGKGAARVRRGSERERSRATTPEFRESL